MQWLSRAMLRLHIENTLDREGKIMAEWVERKISDIGTVVGGATPSTKKPENYEDGKIAWITPKDLSTFSGRYIERGERNITEIGLKSCSTQLLPPNTILFSSRAPIGYVAIAANEVCTNQGFKSVIPNENTDPLFLFYLLKYNKDKIEGMGSGTTFKEVSGNTMKNIVVNVPTDKKVQEKIAAILGTIDDKIEENEQINNNLEQQYISIVDNLLSKLTQYKIYSLLEVADCQNGRAFYKEGYDPNGAFVIDLGNVNTSGNFVRTAADKYISLDRYKEPKLEKYRVYKNDIVMVMTDRKSTMELLGKVGKIYKDGYYLLNQRMYRIRAKEGINTNYLYACLNSTETSNFLKRKALGSVQKYVNTGEINSIEIKVPSSEKMEEIASILDPIFLQMESNILENESLNELRDILLPKLMSGELDVSGIDL